MTQSLVILPEPFQPLLAGLFAFVRYLGALDAGHQDIVIADVFIRLDALLSTTCRKQVMSSVLLRLDQDMKGIG